MSAFSIGERAGFWRRVVAFLIDTLIVSMVVQLMVAFLFFATSGRLQMLGDLSYTSCSAPATVPNGLVPPLPAGVNYARECTITTFFGAPTAKILQVGRTKDGTVSRNGKVVTTTSREILQTYRLDQDGRPVNGILLDWFAALLLISYLVAMETRRGATLGGRAMGIRVTDAAAPAGPGVPGPSVPLRKVLARYAAMLIGVLPLIAVLLVYFALYAAPGELTTSLAKLGRQNALFNELKSTAFQWQPFLSSYLFDLSGTLLRDDAVSLGIVDWLYEIADLALKAWVIYLIVQIVRGRDPVYDRIAGTSVVRS
jgi:uncharacterized RDD family membrane protein YckC